MSRILAIDYGQKRTGIAVTDTLQMIANGLATVETKELEKFIVDYVAKEDVSVIVVGKPTQPAQEALPREGNHLLRRTLHLCAGASDHAPKRHRKESPTEQGFGR